MNWPQPKGLRNPPRVGLSSSNIALLSVAPQLLIPLLQFLPRHLAVAHGGPHIGMPQPFLEHTDAIGGVVLADSHDGKSVPQPVGADAMYLASLGIEKVRKLCLPGALSQN